MEIECSDHGRREAEALLFEVLPFGQGVLDDSGELYPYGAYMRKNGEIVFVGAEIRGEDRPRSAELIHLLNSDFREKAQESKIRAAAIVFDVRVSPPGTDRETDAIQVDVEHIASYCAEVFFPYWRKEDGHLHFGDAFAQPGTRSIFL